MNTQRALILGVAFVAAIFAALLVRNLMGGGTEKTKAAVAPPPRPATSEILVASSDIEPGTALTPDSVRWQQWPKSSVDSNFITQEATPDTRSIVQGTVVRAPVLAGQPLTPAMLVHADGAGYMAATVTQGMRAVSISITTDTGAGGFILPNDHVDVMVTVQVSDTPRRFGTMTLLHNVRVLAVDQTFKEDKDQKTLLAKTATLELTPRQSERIEQAQATGTISLALRALGDTGADKLGKDAGRGNDGDDGPAQAVVVIGYGVGRAIGAQGD
jgi:pilus assembly protein CpaB